MDIVLVYWGGSIKARPLTPFIVSELMQYGATNEATHMLLDLRGI